MTALPARLPPYVVVTPVRDEARHIVATVRSMRAQTHAPVLWVIVDDGSTDATPRLLREATAGAAWIRVVATGSTERQLGSAEVLAFQRGIAEIPPDTAYAYIVKLDGDLELPADYFARLLRRMEADPRWGIASGRYCEWHDGAWVPIAMPPYHAAGASKVLRRACYEAIGGFVASKGWDTVDEIRAGLRGWRTGHADDIRFRHLKPEGAAMGALATHRFHGEIYHQVGGDAAFLVAKALHRMAVAQPRVLGGLAMLWGYAAARLTGRPRLVTRDEARYYRTLLRRRLTAPAARLLPLATRR